MTIQFRCKCGRILSVGDDRSGLEVRCPACGRSIHVPAPDAPVYDVFISYCSKDQDVADAACATLEGRGIRCWIAPRDILAGMNYGESIIAGIESSRVMVLVFSSHANDSEQVCREVERAASRGLRIVPLRIEDIPLSKGLEYFLSTSHWLDAASGPLSSHLIRLGEQVKSLLAKTDRPAPAPAPPPPAAPREEVQARTLAPARPVAVHGLGRNTKYMLIGAVVLAAVAIALIPVFLLAGRGSQRPGSAPNAVPDQDRQEGPSDAAVACYQRGLAHYSSGRYDQASTELEEALRLYPPYTEAQQLLELAKKKRLDGVFRRALAAMSNNDYSAAIAHLTTVISEDPKHELAYLNRGLCYCRIGDHDRARRDANEALRINPTSTRVPVLIREIEGKSGPAPTPPAQAVTEAIRSASRAMAAGDYDEAIRQYSTAIRLDPNYANAYANRGLAHYRKEDYDSAIADFTKAIALAPESGKLRHYRAQAYAQKKDYQAAIADLDEALRKDPDSTERRFLRGQVLFRAGKYDSAIEDFALVIRAEPQSSMGYRWRGMCYAGKGQHDKAVAEFTRALQANPRSALAYYNRSLSHAALGDSAAAKSDMDRATSLNPKVKETAARLSGQE